MTDHYAVVGNPIHHSKSPTIHRAFAETCAHRIQYQALWAPLDGFEAVVRAFFAGGGLGLNVTLPFKLQAFDMADHRALAAQLAGAANALKWVDGEIHAENFDGVGLVADITRNLQQTLTGKRVVILGAGGAARGALLPILDQAPHSVVLANRSVDKASDLLAAILPHATNYHGSASACGLDDLPRFEAEVIINATSASLQKSAIALPDSLLGPCELAYDMVYGQGLTPFLAQARSLGVSKIADGVGMLVEQAACAFAWWRGVEPNTQGVIRDLTVPLV